MKVLAALALAGATLMLVACADDGPPPAPAPNAPQQAQQAESEFSPLEAVQALAAIRDEANAVMRAAGSVVGCDAISERAAEDAREGLDLAGEMLEDLIARVRGYLEDAPLSELEPSERVLDDAAAALAPAANAVLALGDCGPLDDDALIALADEISPLAGIYNSDHQYLYSVHFDQACADVRVIFTRQQQRRERLLGLLGEFDAGRGTRERPGREFGQALVNVQRSREHLVRSEREHEVVAVRLDKRCPS